MATTEFHPDINKLNLADFASILKNYMKVEDTNTARGFYDDFRFFEIGPLPSFNEELTSLWISKGSKGAMQLIKKKLNTNKWSMHDVANHKGTRDYFFNETQLTKAFQDTRTEIASWVPCKETNVSLEAITTAYYNFAVKLHHLDVNYWREIITQIILMCS